MPHSFKTVYQPGLYRCVTEADVKVARWGFRIPPGMYQVMISTGLFIMYSHSVVDDFGRLQPIRFRIHGATKYPQEL